MIQPLGRRILCKPIITEETLPGGRLLLLEDTRSHLSRNQAEIVAVGTRDEDGPCDDRLKPGDWVLLRDFAKASLNDTDEFLVREDDILAVIEL